MKQLTFFAHVSFGFLQAIDPLPPVDHSLINYVPFTKNFYIEHPDIASLSGTGVMDLLSKLNIRLSGVAPPRPVCSFAHLNLDTALMESIRAAGYAKPMPIQAAAVPAALAGRDIVGIAKTGSGKTLAFLWPMITHIMAQVCLVTHGLFLVSYYNSTKMHESRSFLLKHLSLTWFFRAFNLHPFAD